jgi:hypothetical protein
MIETGKKRVISKQQSDADRQAPTTTVANWAKALGF